MSYDFGSVGTVVSGVEASPNPQAHILPELPRSNFYLMHNPEGWEPVQRDDGGWEGVSISASGDIAPQRLPKRLAHSGWYYVAGSEEADLREVAPFPAGEQNEFGDRWNAVFVDGKVGPDDARGAAIRSKFYACYE